MLCSLRQIPSILYKQDRCSPGCSYRTYLRSIARITLLTWLLKVGFVCLFIVLALGLMINSCQNFSRRLELATRGVTNLGFFSIACSRVDLKRSKFVAIVLKCLAPLFVSIMTRDTPAREFKLG